MCPEPSGLSLGGAPQSLAFPTKPCPQRSLHGGLSYSLGIKASCTSSTTQDQAPGKNGEPCYSGYTPWRAPLAQTSGLGWAPVPAGVNAQIPDQIAELADLQSEGICQAGTRTPVRNPGWPGRVSRAALLWGGAPPTRAWSQASPVPPEPPRCQSSLWGRMSPPTVSEPAWVLGGKMQETLGRC